MNFRSYGFWTALAGAVAMLAGALGKYFGVSVNGELISEIIMAVAGVLVALGVVCMPKKQEKADDCDEKEKLEEKADKDSLKELAEEEKEDNFKEDDDK